jgi:hypothetical protein
LTDAPPSKKKIALGAVIALAVSIVVLVTTILPAEYGIDPLGTGEALGLVILSGTVPEISVRTDGIVAQASPYRVDEIVFELEPLEELEYKYRLEAGRSMLYSWTATNFVRSEMHAEADGSPAGTAEFFEIQEQAVQRHGTYFAPFPGIHGWYWKNLSEQPMTLTLRTAGFYTSSTLFRGDSPPQVSEIPAFSGTAAE